ncbi:MAG: YraN family protein, partial [Patescibacteria group bacterium]|nr:YraN family protein [Patescibacteria group bacterium]
GFFIVERNYRCRFGEIDLIASTKNQIIFVEVKTRSSSRYGLPGEAVNAKKRSKYFQIATYYVNYKRLYSFDLRFDVIEIMRGSDGSYSVNHIPNAF